MKVSRALQIAQDEHDDNAAAIGALLTHTVEIERLAWRAAGSGFISANGLRQITEGIRALRACAARVLERHRLVASLLCVVAGGLRLDDPRTVERLPALRQLATRQEEEDAA